MGTVDAVAVKMRFVCYPIYNLMRGCMLNISSKLGTILSGGEELPTEVKQTSLLQSIFNRHDKAGPMVSWPWYGYGEGLVTSALYCLKTKGPASRTSGIAQLRQQVPVDYAKAVCFCLQCQGSLSSCFFLAHLSFCQWTWKCAYGQILRVFSLCHRRRHHQGHGASGNECLCASPLLDAHLGQYPSLSTWALYCCKPFFGAGQTCRGGWTIFPFEGPSPHHFPNVPHTQHLSIWCFYRYWRCALVTRE